MAAEVAPAGRAWLGDEPLEGEALSAVAASVEHPAAGAVVLFVGNVRNHHRGRAVEAITYSAYRSMAQQRLETIVEELETKSLRVAISHRLGRLEVGQASVIIAASSAHRDEAFTASRRALERLKSEVPIWKREHYGDGESCWREEESLRLAYR